MALQPRSAARIMLGVNMAMRAIALLEGMDKLGPPYLMIKERAAERENILRIGLMLVFMEVVVTCISCY
jgi:hypothetical protein